MFCRTLLYLNGDTDTEYFRTEQLRCRISCTTQLRIDGPFCYTELLLKCHAATLVYRVLWLYIHKPNWLPHNNALGYCFTERDGCWKVLMPHWSAERCICTARVIIGTYHHSDFQGMLLYDVDGYSRVIFGHAFLCLSLECCFRTTIQILLGGCSENVFRQDLMLYVRRGALSYVRC